MDVIELIYTVLTCVLLLALVVFMMWYSIPVNKAYLKRKFTGRNWCVVTIRHGGGQLRDHVVCAETKKGQEKPPTFTINSREYIPMEKVTRKEIVMREDGSKFERETTDSIVNLKNSVPVWFFNYDDCKPVALSGIDVEQKFRNPALLNSVFLQVDALYRTKIAKEITALMKTVQSWDLRIWAILGIALLGLIVSVITYFQVSQIQGTVVQVGSILNKSITETVINQFPG